MRTFADIPTPLIFVIVLLVVAAVAGIAFGIYRLLHPKLKEQPRDTSHDLQESLDRILEPVEDEKTAEEISNYKEKDE